MPQIFPFFYDLFEFIDIYCFKDYNFQAKYWRGSLVVEHLFLIMRKKGESRPMKMPASSFNRSSE